MKPRILLLVVFSSLGGVVLLLQTLHLNAAPQNPSVTFNVNTPFDATDANPGDGFCETISGNGVCTLRAAIQESNALAGADVILIPALNLDLTLDIINEDAAAGGDLDITDDLTITGVGWSSTSINGNLLDRIFHIHGAGNPAVHINDLTILYGNTLRTDVGLFDVGGGLYNQSGQVTLDNVHMVDNFGGDDGGAIYNNAGLTIQDSVVIDNRSTRDGGGIANSSNGVLTIANSLIEANRIGNFGFGGGISTYGVLTMTNSTIFNNVAGTGGGIENRGRFFISHSTIISNNGKFDTYGGGGIFNQSYAQVTVLTDSSVVSNTSYFRGGGVSNYVGRMIINASSISYNKSGSDGGGLSIWQTGAITITNSLIDQNELTYPSGTGAGIMAVGSLRLENSTIANNIVNGQGGGIYAKLLDIVILNSTLSGNIADQGGAIFLWQTTSMVITNTAIAENQANTL